MASHIVGGEFEILHLFDNNYRVNLLLYFDQRNGNAQAKDQNVTARIFRKRDNQRMMDVFLPITSEAPVSYTQPACSKGEIVTTKITYTTTIILHPSVYNDPEGYYIVWERCCRNYTITNIYSRDPFTFPSQYAGQTFYLEFPPVIKDGVPFINSSPRLFPPLNDYACPRKLYYADFAGTDDDGDSLVYTLVTPLNTRSADAIPLNGPRPLPYPSVQWIPPFGINNVIGGQPDLKISEDGFLTVTPMVQGLFVFAVKCEEFRNGVKIGELRRDFQMLVVDQCPRAEPPQILGKKLTDTSFSHDNTMNVTFDHTVTDDFRCIEVQISDPDASKVEDNFTERINVKVVPIGFKADISGITLTQTNAVLTNGSTHNVKICFPECPYVDGPYQIGVVAYDDACSLPLFDTLKVTVNVVPPPNSSPYFTNGIDGSVNEGDPLQTWTVSVIDNDNDPVVMGVIPVGFKLEDVGMQFNIIHQENGRIDAALSWDPKCNVYDFSKKSDFEIKFFAEDQDYCLLSRPAILTARLKIILPSNQPPVIDTDLTDAVSERTVDGLEIKVYDHFTFRVTGRDVDDDFIVLNAIGKEFDMNDYAMVFSTTQGKGQINSVFEWDIRCSNVTAANREEFEVEFIVIDNLNKCRIYQADTLNVVMRIVPPENTKPNILLASLNPAQPMENGTISTLVGEQINLGLYGSDTDVFPEQDNLRIELIDAGGTVEPRGYVFTPAQGKGNVETTFLWNTDCSIFENNVYENQYHFTFRVFDDRCLNVKADTTEIDIVIKDVENEGRIFVPGNLVTPNGDDCNEYFALEGVDPACGEDDPDGAVSLPYDNCRSRFEGITIFNRWGKEVYHSAHRNFRWYPDNEANGIYFYLLKFSDGEYKGSVTVRY